MSADLFAEFGSGSSAQQSQTSNAAPKPQPAPFSFFDDFTTPQPRPQIQQQQPRPLQVQQSFNQTADADDDWGDFEGASSTAAASAPAPLAPVTQPEPLSFQSFPSQAQQQNQPPPYQAESTWNRAPVFKAKKSYDSNVLFDAEEEADDDDEFGEFEETPASPPPAVWTSTTAMPRAAPQSGGLIDLLGDLDISQPPSQTQKHTTAQKQNQAAPARHISTSSQQKNKVHGFGPLTKKKEDVPISPPSPTKKEDTWDSFDDWEASIPATKNPAKPTSVASASASQTRTTAAQPVLPSTSQAPVEVTLTAPPTNIPPPALLLSLFLPLFGEAHEKLFKPLAAQALPMRNRLLADPATITYLRAYLAVASVAARIIAGRKLRWKRDSHLSQSMRIGPASSRASSGMKLTGIDKSESMKEEREVADVVRAWKEGMGRLRSAVASVNQRKNGELGAVPNLEEDMKVKTLKQSEGGVPSRMPCFLCGLKRDERVVVESDVDDIFGEWWVEGVSMHRGMFSISRPLGRMTNG